MAKREFADQQFDAARAWIDKAWWHLLEKANDLATLQLPAHNYLVGTHGPERLTKPIISRRLNCRCPTTCRKNPTPRT
jgi:hypothetical protein